MRLIRAAQTLAAAVALWIGLMAPGAAAGEAAEGTTSINAPARTIAGLTFDGKRLWCADRASRTLFALEAATGKVLKRLPLPGPHAEQQGNPEGQSVLAGHRDKGTQDAQEPWPYPHHGMCHLRRPAWGYAVALAILSLGFSPSTPTMTFILV